MFIYLKKTEHLLEFTLPVTSVYMYIYELQKENVINLLTVNDSDGSFFSLRYS